VLSSGGMSKEEKAAEIARRKEERKQVCVDFLHFMTSHKPYHVTAHSSVKGAKEELFQYELIFIWVSCVKLDECLNLYSNCSEILCFLVGWLD
jgi:hypothetical protein